MILRREKKMIKYLENEKLGDLVKEGIYLVDFYADWCGPCKILGQVLEGLNDINIIKVNTDQHQELATEYGVMSIPTLVFFKDGQSVKKEIGFKTEEEIRNIINSLK